MCESKATQPRAHTRRHARHSTAALHLTLEHISLTHTHTHAVWHKKNNKLSSAYPPQIKIACQRDDSDSKK